MRPETDEEKKWFLMGYIQRQAEEFAEEFGYTVKEAREILVKEFLNSLNN